MIVKCTETNEGFAEILGFDIWLKTVIELHQFIVSLYSSVIYVFCKRK
jgi:hypothetical protein